MNDTQLLIKFILRNTAGLTHNILCYLVKNYWFPLRGSQMRQRLQHSLNYTPGKRDNRNHLKILMWHCYYRGLLILTIIIDLIPNYTSVAGCLYCVRFIHKGKPLSGSLIGHVSLMHFPVFASAVNFWTLTSRVLSLIYHRAISRDSVQIESSWGLVFSCEPGFVLNDMVL